MTSIDSSPSRASWLGSALGLGAEERVIALRTMALFLVIQTTHGLGANAADTLFFLRFGVDELPKMIVLAGVVVMVTLLAHSAGLSSLGVRRWLPMVLASSAAWVLLTWLAVFADYPLVYAVIWVANQGIIMLTFTMLWNVAGAVCTTRQAKRLFPLFATAGVLGGVIGNLATAPISTFLGTQSLLLVQASLLVVGIGVIRLIIPSIQSDEEERKPALGPVDQVLESLRSIRSSRLLRIAAVLALLTGILFYLVVFPFSEAVATSFDTESEVASYLGIFSSVATALTFAIGLFVAKRLLARVGIVTSLLILPLVYVVGFGWWLIEFDLVSATAFRGAQWVALNAIWATAFTALFNVVTGRRRAQVVAFMTAVPAQLGAIIGGLLLLAGGAVSDILLFGLAMATSAAVVSFVLAMRTAYLEAVLSAVRKGLVGVFSVPGTGLFSPVDAEARRVLENHLTDERPGARAYSLSALARLHGSAGVEHAAGYLRDDDPHVRIAAFEVLCEWAPDAALSHIDSALSDESPDVRIRALQYVASRDAGALAVPALQDPDLRVRAAAAAIVGDELGGPVGAEVLGGEDPRAKRSLLNTTLGLDRRQLHIDFGPLLSDEDPEVRALAVRVGRDDLDFDTLRPLLDEPSLRVRVAAAEVLAHTEHGRSQLVEILETGTVNETEAVLRAISPLEELTEDFVDWAMGEAQRAAHLDRLRRAVAADEEDPVARLLEQVLASRAARLEQWVLKAMTTTETLHIMPLVQRGVVSRDAETRAQAIEALETIGERRILGVLLPLLDRSTEDSGIDRRTAYQELAGDFDPWLRALAISCLARMITVDLAALHQAALADPSDLVRDIVPSLGPMPIEKSDTLGMMDRVLALQAVSMFSQLDPEDLEVLAAVMSEVAYEPNEAIFQEGAEGSEALLIAEGSAIVSITREATERVVAEYGPGDSVGELALLGSGVRSADVTAGPDGLHGFVISRIDLISVLEEQPSVALGMLATLAGRLVDET